MAPSEIPENGAAASPEGSPSSEKAQSSDKKLDGWKEISNYLGRDKRTVQRWEQTESLPIRRHEHEKKSTVYAYASELDEWRKTRQPKEDPGDNTDFEPDLDDEPSLETENGNGTAPSVEPALAQQSAGTSSPEEPELPPSPRKWLGVVLAAAVVLSLAAYAIHRWLPSANPAPQKVRLVVLPFTNLSGDPQQDYFSAGLTDEMITRLGNLDPQHLGVIAAVSSTALAGKPVAEIGRALDVQYALEGTVRRVGNRVRIDAQLIQMSDQTQLWANSYDRDLNDILSVQDDVATSVANEIRLALSPSSGKGIANAPSRSVNREAYDAYLRGRFYWTNRGDLHKSVDAYQEAIQKDSQYALAYAGLASAYALLGQVPYDDLTPSDAKPKARDAADRALQLDPQLSEAHAVLANVEFSYDWNFPAAEREFQQAIALGPNNPIPHIWYGQYCIARNRLSQALEENSRALDLDPVSPLFNTVRAEIYYHERNYDAAIEQGRRTIEQYSNYPLAYIWLGSAYREKKMYAEALEQFSKGRQLSGDRPVLIALYAHALAVSGDKPSARKVLADLKDLARTRYVSSLYFAAIYTGLGENSTALDWLDRAYRERNDRLLYLGLDPIADPLRSEPRFTQLLRKVGLH